MAKLWYRWKGAVEPEETGTPAGSKLWYKWKGAVEPEEPAAGGTTGRKNPLGYPLSGALTGPM